MSTVKNSHSPSALEQIIEKFVFKHRALMMTIIVSCIALLTIQAVKVKPEASFTKMIPGSHSYVTNFLTYKKELADLGNVIRIVVENTHADDNKSDIFNEEFQQTLKQVTDEVFFIPGVSRDGLKSLWTPNVRWQEVTEEGFVGGAVIPDGYDGSPEMIERVK
ncbi:MAG TPA: RND transporter, partial [Colwellia sp.]|nr:RND transporter [Colwellia sp.]